MFDIKLEHVLMSAIIAFLLYHLVGRCGMRSRDGFSVDGANTCIGTINGDGDNCSNYESDACNNHYVNNGPIHPVYSQCNWNIGPGGEGGCSIYKNDGEQNICTQKFFPDTINIQVDAEYIIDIKKYEIHVNTKTVNSPKNFNDKKNTISLDSLTEQGTLLYVTVDPDPYSNFYIQKYTDSPGQQSVLFELLSSPKTAPNLPNIQIFLFVR